MGEKRSEGALLPPLSGRRAAWLMIAHQGANGLDSLERFLHGSRRPPMPAAAPEIGTDPDACRIVGECWQPMRPPLGCR